MLFASKCRMLYTSFMEWKCKTCPETDIEKKCKNKLICKRCHCENVLARQKTPEGKATLRRARWMYLYGITEEQYDALLEAQGGGCAICNRTQEENFGGRYLSVDHDHACCPGKRSCGQCIRGLLCHRCNNNMGWFDVERENILAYLKETT